VPDLSDQIEQAANDPAAASVDGQSVTATPIPDLIAADKYLAAKEAAAVTSPTGPRRSAWATGFARGVTEGMGTGRTGRRLRGGLC
jgi:hypothetical protein